jgi:hypothetical protein
MADESDDEWEDSDGDFFPDFPAVPGPGPQGFVSIGWDSGEVWKLDTARMSGPNGCLGPSSEDSNMIFQISSVLGLIQCTSLGLGFAADYFMNLAADYFTNLLTRKQIQSVTPSSQQYLFVWLAGWLVLLLW